MKERTTHVRMRIFHDKKECGLCGKPARRLFSFNKDAEPDFCDDCLNGTRAPGEVFVIDEEP